MESKKFKENSTSKVTSLKNKKLRQKILYRKMDSSFIRIDNSRLPPDSLLTKYIAY